MGCGLVLFVLLSVVGSSGCGGGVDHVEIRVGGQAITSSEITHRMAANAPEHFVPDAPRYEACVDRLRSILQVSDQAVLKTECEDQYDTLRRQALSQLIVDAWLEEAAREEGLPASEQDDATAAALALRSKVFDEAGHSSPTQAAHYYRTHIRGFVIPERRYFDIDNRPTEAAAQRDRRRMEAGESFSSISPIHEMIERPTRIRYPPGERVARAVIFTAPLHRLGGPIKVYGAHSLFIVTRVVPARVRPFTSVRGQIEARLTAERRRRALGAFISAWRRKWTARTSCSPGFVVQKCREYQGARAPEASLELD